MNDQPNAKKKIVLKKKRIVAKRGSDKDAESPKPASEDGDQAQDAAASPPPPLPASPDGPENEAGEKPDTSGTGASKPVVRKRVVRRKAGAPAPASKRKPEGVSSGRGEEGEAGIPQPPMPVMKESSGDKPGKAVVNVDLPKGGEKEKNGDRKTGADPESKPEPLVSVKKPAELVVKFYCIRCGQKLGVPATGIGKKISCPNCKNRIEVPDPLPQDVPGYEESET